MGNLSRKKVYATALGVRREAGEKHKKYFLVSILLKNGTTGTVIHIVAVRRAVR